MPDNWYKDLKSKHYLFLQVQELKDNQIRVGKISPGVVETEIFSTVKPDPKMPFKMEDIFKFLPNIKADHVSA